MKKKLIIISLLILILMSVQIVSASDDADINVLGDNGENQILSAPTEYKTYADLKDLIDTAQDGDEIPLAYNYKYDNQYGSSDPKTGINITKNLTIVGNGAIINGSSASALFNVSEGVTLTLKNLTIVSAAYKEGWSAVDFVSHSAITSKGTLKIYDCTFENNKPAESWMEHIENANGSVIYSTEDIYIENSKFLDNCVATSGIIYTTGRVSIKGSQFEDNIAYGDDYKGGAIYTEGGIDIIEDSYFSQNGKDGKGNGGAIYIANPNAVTSIRNVTFDFNYAANGGAIYTEGIIDCLNDSNFWGDMAINGGAIYAKAVNSIDNVTFDTCGYYTDASKGAVYITGSDDLVVTNSTFTGCMAGEGAGIYTGGGVSVIDSEVTKCVANSYDVITKGAFICADGEVTIENTALLENFAKEGGVVYSNSSITIKNCNNIQENGLDDNNLASNGGVAYAKGDVILENVAFGANYANVAGGAIYAEGNVYFYNSSVNGSAATKDNGNGGFIYAKGNVEVENSTVASVYMKVADGNGKYSGAVYTESDITIRNSNFTNINKADNSYGGAIRALGNAEIYESNFTNNRAELYGAGHVGGTLYIYDSNFINNTHGTIFSEGLAVVNNTWFINNTGGAVLNGRALGSNATLNLTNSYVVGTNGSGGIFNGTVFSNGNLYIENCTISDNHAYAAKPRGMAICTNSNITIINCNMDNNTFSGNDVYGGAIYAGINAYVENCNFTNSSLLERSGNSHGVAIYAKENVTVYNSTFENLQSWNSEDGAITGNYVNVHNSNFTNIFGFGAFGAAIHANVANVTDSSFHLINSSDNKDNGGAIYANNTYAYRNNFTECHAGRGGAIYSENYTEAIENIFINNHVQYSGGAIYTNNGFIEYNVLIGNGKSNAWGDLCDVAFKVSADELDSLERNWWGHNRPFENDGENRAKTSMVGDSGGSPYLPDTWVIMKFFITDPNEPYIGQGVNLTTTLEDYYNHTDGQEYDLNHNIAKRTVIYSTNSTDEYDGKFSHDSAPIINEDTVLYYSNNFVEHKVSSTIDYQTLYLDVAQFEINVTKTVTNSTPKVGDIINYTITVTSNDTTDYSNPNAVIIPHNEYYNITITDILDNRLQFISSNDTKYNNGTGEWYIENLKINSTYVLNIKVRVKGSGNITNWANITKVNDTVLSNPHGVNVTIEVEEYNFVELDIQKEIVSDVSSVVVGNKINYTITVTNNGNINATNVRVTDTLAGPASIVYSECVVPTGSTFENNLWTINTLENGTSTVLRLVVLTTGDGTVANSVVGNCDENDTPVSDDAPDVPVSADVHLNVTKEVASDVSDLHVGDTIVYTINVTNSGKSDATGVNVTEDLSDLVVVIGADANGRGSWNNVTKVWEVGTVGADGDSAVLTLTVRVIGAGTVTNGVTAKAKENDTPVSDDAPDVPVSADVHLNVTKEVASDVSDLHVGDTIVYTINVTNSGKSDATGVNVTEDLSDLVVVIGADANGRGSWNNVTKVWEVGTVGADGDSAVLTLTVRVIGAGTVTNGVTAKAKENDTPVSDDAPDVPVSADVHLNVTKELVTVGPVYAGDKIVYVIKVTNNGLSDAHNVVVSDTLSGPAVIVPGECVVPVGSSLVGNVWTIDVLGAGNETTLTLVVRTTAEGSVANNVTAKSDENDTNVSDGAPEAEVNPDVRLNVTKELVTVGPVYAGDKIVYVIKVTNNGLSDAHNVVVSDTLSGPAVIVPGECVVPVGSSLVGNVWTIDVLGAGNETTLTLVVRTTAEGSVANNVTAKSDENDTNVSDGAPEAEVNPIVDVAIDLEVDNTTPDMGSNVIITLKVKNNGPSTATQIKGKLNRDFLNGLKIISIDSDDIVFHEGLLSSVLSNILSVNEDGTFEINYLNAGQEVNAIIKAQIIREGTIVVNGTVSSYEKDSNLSNNDDLITMTVHSIVNLSVNKTVNNINPTIGDIIEYTITVANAGPSNATDVVVLEKLPAGLIYVSDNGEGAYNYNTGVWNIDSINAKATKSLTIKVKVNAIGAITNTVNASAEQDNINLNGSKDNVTINVKPKVVDLKVTIDANTTKSNLGDLVEFTVTIVNKGTTNATGVNIYNDLPDGFKFIRDDGNGTFDSKTGVWTIGNLTAGQTKVLHIVVQSAKVGNITYSAKATANEEIKNTTSAQDSITIEVVEHMKPNSTNKTQFSPEIKLKPTGNPLIVLIIALMLVGVSLRRKKQ